jgi:hypothetical protein
MRLGLYNTALFSFAYIFLLSQNIYINEFSSVNTNLTQDDDGDFEDWIELFNAETYPVNLNGYTISDNLSQPFKWTFPDTIIQSGEHLIVWASGKDKRIAGLPLHANFKISTSGENLILTNPSGDVIDQIQPIKLRANISYGRYPDGENNFFYFQTPTPLSQNLNNGYSEILEPVQFSVNGGFYSDSFQLILSHPDTNVTILYTIDSSDPDSSNLNYTRYQYKLDYAYMSDDPFGNLLLDSFKTHFYNTPVLIVNQGNTPKNSLKVVSAIDSYVFESPPTFPVNEIFQGIVVKAIASKPNALNSEVVSNTYIIGDRTSFALPIISITTQETNLFDYVSGIYTPGLEFDQWRLDNSDENYNCDAPSNFKSKGREYERTASFEFFAKDSNQPNIKQDIGIRIFGGCGRVYHQKSFKLYARSEYSNENLDFAFFQYYSFDSFKRLILRNGGDDTYYTLFRDPLIHLIAQPLSIETQRYQPVNAFINGEFWGIYNLRETQDKHFIKRKFGIDAYELDLLKEIYESSTPQIQEGSSSDYEVLVDFVRSNDMAESTNYQYVSEKIDFNSFIDYFILQIFVANTDWPDGNNKFWRKNDNLNTENIPFGHDGKWRWLLFDTDFSIGLHIDEFTDDFPMAVNVNLLNYTQNWHTLNVSDFWENELFLHQFINRFCDLLNTAFLPERTIGIIDSLENLLESSIQMHKERWPFPITPDVNEWKSQVALVRDFAIQRPQIQRNHLYFFNLDGEILIKLNVSDSTHGIIKINTIEIDSKTEGIYDPVYPWEGTYFKNIPISISAISKPGYKFSHWIGVDEIDSTFILPFMSDSIEITAVFTENSSSTDITPIHYWHFNLLNTDQYANVKSDTSFTGVAYIEYLGEGSGYMDGVNDGSSLNLLFNNSEGRGLRVRNPTLNRHLLFHLPTVGYENLNFQYVVKKTINGVDKQLIQFQIHPDSSWVFINDTINVTDNFQLINLDLSLITQASNNPFFKIRILFEGDNIGNLSGNNRFDNISLSGSSIKCHKSVVAHYFDFNNLSLGELESIIADSSITPVNATLTYGGNGLGYMDRVNDGSLINAQFNSEDSYGLRVRNPSNNREIIFSLPTNNLSDIKFNYAVKKTINGASKQVLSYNVGNNIDWIYLPDTISIKTNYELISIDFTDLISVNNNPDFKIRIEFEGSETSNSTGNNRFDNITLTGKKIPFNVTEVNLCNGDSYNFNGNEVFSAGLYQLMVYDINECDSIVEQLLVKINNPYTFIQDSACSQYIFNENIIISSGLYYDTLLSSIGCDSIIELELTVYDVNLYVHQENGILYSSVSDADEYLWFSCNDTLNPLGNSSDYFLNPSEEGSYYIQIAKKNCLLESECVDFNLTGIELIDLPQFKVSPNPFSNILILELSNNIKLKKISIEIFSVLGQQLYSENFYPTSNYLQLDKLEHLKNGIHLLKVSVENNVNFFKISKNLI